MIYATASELIPIGALVLVRGDRVGLASQEIANGRAVKSIWGNRPYKPGDRVTIEPIDGLGSRDLNAIANGPIMDPNRIYLPAGKCSEDEMRRREAWREEG